MAFKDHAIDILETSFAAAAARNLVEESMTHRSFEHDINQPDFMEKDVLRNYGLNKWGGNDEETNYEAGRERANSETDHYVT